MNDPIDVSYEVVTPKRKEPLASVDDVLRLVEIAIGIGFFAFAAYCLHLVK